jgi:hypothetical protein
MVEKENTKILDIQKHLKTGKSIPLLDKDDIKYLQKPIGKALYTEVIGRPKKKEEDKAHPSDRLFCNICGGKYVRSHRSAHNKTKVHQAYAKMNHKLSRLLLDVKD